MTGESYEIHVQNLPRHRVTSARLVLGVGPPTDTAVIVLDPDRNQFVRVPDLPGGRVLSLSADGTHLLLLSPRGAERYGALCLHTLATGQQRWYSATTDGQDWLAALSPDNGTIAALTTTPDPARPGDPEAGLVALTLIDTHTAQRRRLWSTPGGWSAESTLSWSPKADMIAATYWIEGARPTIVVDLHGAVLTQLDHAMIPPSANGAWVTDTTLLCVDDDFQLVLADLPTGTHHTINRHNRIPRAVIGSRLVNTTESILGNPTRLVTTDLDGTDPRPYLTIYPSATIHLFDTARP